MLNEYFPSKEWKAYMARLEPESSSECASAPLLKRSLTILMSQYSATSA